jgi:hypothetical protein
MGAGQKPVEITRLRSIALALAITVLATTADAHHSVLGQFDVSKVVTLTGTIAKVDWINPHAYVYLDVKATDGRMTKWALSTIPIAMMRKGGISREALTGKTGETVRVKANPALNGKPFAWIIRITYADGHYFALFE